MWLCHGAAAAGRLGRGPGVECRGRSGRRGTHSQSTVRVSLRLATGGCHSDSAEPPRDVRSDGTTASIGRPSRSHWHGECQDQGSVRRWAAEESFPSRAAPTALCQCLNGSPVLPDSECAADGHGGGGSAEPRSPVPSHDSESERTVTVTVTVTARRSHWSRSAQRRSRGHGSVVQIRRRAASGVGT